MATWQAEFVKSELGKQGIEVEILFISTEGDQSTQSLKEFGGQGAFTKRIQQALLDEEIDFAVHSLKDLPTERVDGLELVCVPPREATEDVWVSNKYEHWKDAEPDALVGTGSLRRQAQLLHLKSDFRVSDIRGNVDTRLQKLDDGEFDAIVLAKAGLTRLGLGDRITAEFVVDEMLPAIGQGALGLEARSGDLETNNALAVINDAATHAAVLAERGLLRELRAGCLAPVGASAVVNGDDLNMSAVVLNQQGTKRVAGTTSGSAEGAEALGVALAQELIGNGAQELLDRK